MEFELDKVLKIKTSGRDASIANYLNFPYEATPYKVLQELANSGYISRKDTIVDFGCGKGRVDFYLAFAVKCNMIGIEYDERLYNVAEENKKTCISSSRTTFINCNAIDYVIDDNITGVYFFNPFSIDILKVVIANIIESKKRKDRKILLFFYYPSVKYLDFLKQNNIKYVDIIDCLELFDYTDDNEYIAIYEI